jgi:beta-N-acetylhexosaminidase
MKASESYGTMPKRARLALEAGCDMILICNDRPAAQAAVSSLEEYSNPLSLVRLARLHGTGQVLRESLLASEEWQVAAKRFIDWQDRPPLELNA